MIKASILLIGSELLDGHISDKNIKTAAFELKKVGINLDRSIIIRDNLIDLTNSLDILLNNSDLVLITGGLGPTEDDITLNFLSEYFQSELIIREDHQNLVNKHFQRFGKERKFDSYTKFPKDFTPIENPKGLAPGVFFEKNGKIIISAPGVPYEFESMLKEKIIDHILDSKILSKKLTSQIYSLTIKTAKIPEEKIFFELCPNLWNDLGLFGNVSSLPTLFGVNIVISFEAKSKDDCDIKKKKIINFIKSTPLNDYIWQFGDLELWDYVIQKLQEKNLTIATAESCTGGLVSSKLTDVSGSSSVVLGGVVSYSNEIKKNILNVKPESLEKYGAVSREVALEMARGVQTSFQSNITISLSGIAGPGGGTKEKPVGLVAIGYTYNELSGSEFYQFRGDRETLKQRFCSAALHKVLELLK